VLLRLDEWLGVDASDFAELAQEARGGVQADGGHEVGAVELFAELAAEFLVHADVDGGIREFRHVHDVAAEREDEIDLAADAFDEAADLGDIGRHVEGAVDGTDDVDEWF
jgi:hypothetical protein